MKCCKPYKRIHVVHCSLITSILSRKNIQEASEIFLKFLVYFHLPLLWNNLHQGLLLAPQNIS